jgi:deoxyribose-phosphate aldolase
MISESNDRMNLSEEQRKRIIEKVIERVGARVNGGAVGTSPNPAIVPCAIPPPGTPRYEMAMQDRVRELKTLVDGGAGRIGRPGDMHAPACADLAPYLDHTLLRPDAKENEIVELCREAARFKFASVCVNPNFVPVCAGMLKGTGVKVCTVVGFPLGAMTTEAKAFETRDAVAKGADEIDMVINIGRLKSKDYAYVHEDIKAVAGAAQGRTVKVILETALLAEDEKIAACVIARAAGAHFVKTSTGFAGKGATAEDVRLMRQVVGTDLGVKAAGGVRDCETAQKMIESGATRIGASASVAIVTAKEEK